MSFDLLGDFGSCHSKVVIQLSVSTHAPDLAVEIIVGERASPDKSHPKAVWFDDRIVWDVIRRSKDQRKSDIAPNAPADPRRGAIILRIRTAIFVSVMKPNDPVILNIVVNGERCYCGQGSGRRRLYGLKQPEHNPMHWHSRAE